MTKSVLQERVWQRMGLIAGAAMLRLVSVLPPNMSPVGAMGLYAGAQMRLPEALFVTCAVMLLSDAVLGLYHPVGMLLNYLGMSVGVLLGHILLKNGKTLRRQILAATLGAGAFFVLSNVGVWLSSGLYPLTMEGLRECFVAAVPFFRNTLIGNLVFTLFLFSVDNMLSSFSYSFCHNPGRK